MITRHSRKGVTWIDLEQPSREELRAVMNEFNIGARVEEEVISPTPYPLVLSSSRYVYLVLHFPTANPDGGARSQEIDFVVGKKFLITARYEVVEAIHSLHRVFEAEELLDLPMKSPNADVLIERVLRHVYGAIREHAENAARMMERIEDDIFAGKEREMVRAISLTGRVLLRFDTTLTRHAEPLEAFLKDLSKPAFFGKDFELHAMHIQAEHDHTAALVHSYRAVVGELRTTNQSLLSANQNSVIQTLTIMTFAAFPLSVIAGLFGMNNEYLPFIDSPNFFWIILGIMVFAVIVILSFFKYKRWF